MNYFLNWNDHVGSQAEKFYKTAFWQGEQMMVGMNCLEVNQKQDTHAHEGADKFYFVLEGRGSFIVGNENRDAEPGVLVFAPAGVPHGVSNNGTTRLSLLVAIAPPPVK